MTRYEFDVSKLMRHLDERRERMGMSWRRFADEVGVDQALLHRLRAGKKPGIDAGLTLLLYLGVDYLPYLHNAGSEAPDQN